ncbi:LamB/YcsF family protein [Burkholderia sp. RS01]|uniref:LamB/YcsF family protein n=1 Tax=unclassified Burkholderia TaxID=2613784 RepID=UPI003218930D
MDSTCHESAAARLGVRFVAELYVHLDHRADGTAVANRAGHQLDLERAASRTRQVVEHRTITAEGAVIQVRPDTICIHSDLPNSVELAISVRRALLEQP